MHILVLSHYYPPEGNAPATRTHAHARRWAAAGHRVTVITSQPNCPGGVVYDGYANRVRPTRETIDGVEVVRVWTWVAANAGMRGRIANYVSFMLSSVWQSLREDRPDVVLATSPQFFNGWAGVLAKWLRRRPLVLEIRDIWPESITTVGAMRRGSVVRWLERLERRMYRAADRIVTVGDGYRRNIESKVTPRQPIAVVTNGVDLTEFDPDDTGDDFRKQHRLGDAFVCSYIGTVGMAHGLEVVLDAAERLDDESNVRFVIVGDGAERARLEAEAAARQLADRVVFTGRLPKAEMPAALAASDCCLVHLKGCELFGTVIPSKIFETMAMGRPIIMGVRGEAAAIVETAEAGVPMEPDNAADLAHQVTTLSEQPLLRARLSRRGPAFVAEHYNRDQLAADMMRAIGQAAGVEVEQDDRTEPIERRRAA